MQQAAPAVPARAAVLWLASVQARSQMQGGGGGGEHARSRPGDSAPGCCPGHAGSAEAQCAVQHLLILRSGQEHALAAVLHSLQQQ